MSKQDDIKFCQVAIQAGMVTQEQAKKCLAFAQKMENDGKSRPKIGAVFVKAKVLSQAQVSQVQQALQKRNGTGARAGKARGAGARGGAAAARRGKRGGRAAREAAEPRRASMPRRGGGGRSRVSKEMVWLYIGSGVGVIILLIAMVLMLLHADQAAEDAELANQQKARAKEQEKTTSLLDATPGTSGAPAAREVSRDSDFYKDFAARHQQAILDSGADFRDDRYGRALAGLQRFIDDNAASFDKWPDMREALENEMASIRQKVQDRLKETLDEVAEAPRDEKLKALEAFKDRCLGNDTLVALVDAEITKITG